MNKKSISITVPLPALVALIIVVALFATGLNAGSLLADKPLSALASYSVEQAKQPGQGHGAPLSASAGSSFLYQGSLKSGGTSANGPHDFRFTLYDAPEAGTVISPVVTIDSIPVTNGLFITALDFGPNAFNGDARSMQIEVRQAGGESYSPLEPRQPIAPAPYALFALKTQTQKNVVTVAQAGGQFTSIQAALNSITEASATNHFVVRVAPGTYTERVTMKQYVDIEGSGEEVTKISFTGSSNQETGTVVGARNAELRFLTVENLGGAPPNNRAKAIFNYDDFPDASLSLLQVTAIASGGVLNIGVHNWNLSPNMTNVTASASGSDGSTNYGVLNEGSSSKMTNVTASASGSGGAFNIGVSCINQPSPNMTNVRGSAFGGANSYGMFANNCAPRIGASDLSASGATNNYGVGTNGGGPMMINNSKITGSTNTIRNEAGGVIRVGASQLVGGSVINLGTISCSASYDENYFSPGLNVCP